MPSYINEETSLDSNQVKLNKFYDQLFLAGKLLYTLTSILIIIGNSLVLLATWREKSLHQPNKYFIACLAVADLFVGIFIGPVKVYGLSMDYESLSDMSIHLCRFMLWADTLVLTASVYTLIFISFDRYFKISKPLQYRSRMTTSKSLIIIFFIWLISSAFATYAATPDSGSYGFLAGGGKLCLEFVDVSDETLSKRRVFYTILFVTVVFLPALVILVMYALIFAVAHKRQKILRKGELGVASTVQKERSVLLQDLKIVRMLLMIVGVFIFCWFPFVIYCLIDIYNPEIIDWNSSSLTYLYSVRIPIAFIIILPLFNSVCNPIMYACLDQSYREAFKHLFQKVMRRPRSIALQPTAVITVASAEK